MPDEKTPRELPSIGIDSLLLHAYSNMLESSTDHASPAQVALTLPNKPSIAGLPFHRVDRMTGVSIRFV